MDGSACATSPPPPEEAVPASLVTAEALLHRWDPTPPLLTTRCFSTQYEIKRYMLNTHAETHSNYTVDIEQIFKVSRPGESERFRKFSDLKNRMLLWHGSRLTNWTGILSKGLRIAAPEAPVTGYMFGKGVYFADMFSKSANYCFASQQSRTSVLLYVR